MERRAQGFVNPHLRESGPRRIGDFASTALFRSNHLGRRSPSRSTEEQTNVWFTSGFFEVLWGKGSDGVLATGFLRPGVDFERDILPLLETVQ